MNMRLLLAFALAAVAAVAAAAPVGAISGGTADSATTPLYPEVVALGYPPTPDLPPEFQGTALQRCVATLVADTVPTQARLLTAGHCAAPANVQLYVSFAADAPPTSSSWTPVDGTVVQQPGAGHDRGDPKDLGVVAIPDSMVPPGITPATLPAAGALATLRHGDQMAIAGYGCERVAQNGGPATVRCGNFTRRYTTAPFQALRPSILALNANTAGGACFADSGAPVFKLNDAPPRAVLATTSGGNALCNSVERFYRTDTPTARRFLRSQGIAVP